MNKRALISVSNKDGVLAFAQGLLALGYEIVSTGGTAALLQQNGLPVTMVDEITAFPECLDGRVKTLHPKVHGGILAVRSNPAHMQTLQKLAIGTIDIVAVNLYPFRATVANPQHSLAQAIENIDIGGPSMIRAAAKNYKYVTVLTSSEDYADVIAKLTAGTLAEEDRFRLAAKAFLHTAHYDAIIANYLAAKTPNAEEYPQNIVMPFDKKQGMRYGENPHQTACYYVNALAGTGGLQDAVFIQGKELSYNNINDTQGAIDLVREFNTPACAAVKHASPCGVALGENSLSAYEKAYACDPLAIFGGIVAFNCCVGRQTAEKMAEIFLEVIIAPSYTADALELLAKKQNLRVLQLASLAKSTPFATHSFKSQGEGLLVQRLDCNNIYEEKLEIVTKAQPTPAQIQNMRFGMVVAKHVKSNAIVIVQNGATVGIGGGEVSRIAAAGIALKMAGQKAKGGVLASDAFFPFEDTVALAASFGVAALIQPGGSVKDKLSVEKCNENGMAMAFTGLRHFRH